MTRQESRLKYISYHHSSLDFNMSLYGHLVHPTSRQRIFSSHMRLTAGQSSCYFLATSLTEYCQFGSILTREPFPVAARNNAWVCGRSLAGIAGSNSALSVVCCHVEVFVSSWTFVQRSRTGRVVSNLSVILKLRQ